jgi:4-hydroxy-3-methylbut-2-en-1-yl diphosphate synthase IspG/GcpE
LAQDVKRMTDYAREHKITIAVMGCRVNGPGETDRSDNSRTTRFCHGLNRNSTPCSQSVTSPGKALTS